MESDTASVVVGVVFIWGPLALWALDRIARHRKRP